MVLMVRSRSLTRYLMSALGTLLVSGVPARAAQPQLSSSHLLAPTALRCAKQTNPLAVADGKPEFSWQLAASYPALHGVAQTAFEIQVAVGRLDSSRAGDSIWDSGFVHSNEIAGIRYAGPSLIPQQAYEWRVRVWDEHNHPSAWSSYAHWTQAPDSHAQWIAAPPLGTGSEGEALPIFRKSFILEKGVSRATLYASGLGQDELRLNGHKVGDDELTPGWSDYRKTVYYDTYDVTRFLHRGENALGVLLGNGMYRVLKTAGRYTKFTGAYGAPKCAVLLHVEFAGGKSLDISSDGTWKTIPGPIVFSSTYGGEDYDARQEQQGWDGPGFDDSQWNQAALVDGPGGTLMPEAPPPLRVMHIYSPIKVSRLKPGVTVYDLGQNFAGWPEISVAGPSGAKVKLIAGELLNGDGTVSQHSSGGPQWFTYTLRGVGTETWHPRFSYYGFRYVQVECTGRESSSDDVRILGVRGQAVHSTSQAIGSFESSNELLNRIHTLILRAIENNAVSLFTDCPHREKLGWLEETHLLAPSMLYDFDFARLYDATARNIADAQTSDGPSAGRVPEIAPQYAVFGVANGIFDDSPEWGSAAVLAPWYVYLRDGDRDFLAAQIDVMRRYVAYLATRAHEGIIDYGLGDWLDIGPGKPGTSKLTTAGVTATAIYYQDLLVLEKATALLGKTEESRNYAQQAAEVRTAFSGRFFEAAQHRYDKGSQTAQAMPLALGLVPEDQRAAVLDTLVADIRAHGNHVTAGDIGYHYVVDALLDGGRSDVLLDMLERTDKPGYGYQLAQGATSLTEAWDANPNSSQDHFMLGHAEEWFYRGLGGINIDFAAKGAERLVFRPETAGDLAWVRTRYQSALGLVESSWTRRPTDTIYDFNIPANSTGTIEVNAESPGAVTINGAPASKAPGVLSVKQIARRIQIVAGSGHYHVDCVNPQETRSERVD
jgi:hypothetical protein